MTGQTHYHVYRIFLACGKEVVGCSPDEDLWDHATTSHVQGKRTWLTLTKWDGANPWNQEAQSGRFVEVNLDHVTGVEKWREWR